MGEAPKPLTWWEPAFGDAEAEAVAAVVASGYVNEGPVTEELTAGLARFLGVKHVVATCNGTAALFLALRACGVGPDDEVVVPDLTFIATASAVRLCGAQAVLVDVAAGDLNLDPERVAAVLTSRTRAIVAVSINGRPADVDALREIAAPRGIAVVEDAAQALGSRRAGRAVGSFGDAGTISLAPTKIITSGQGGLVLTDSDEIRDRVIRLKDHGRLSRSWNHHPEVGFNFKFSDLHAALALVQLGQLPERIERCRSQYRQYAEGLAGVAGVELLDTDLAGGTVPLWVDALVDDPEALGSHLKERQIACRPFWPTVHSQEPYRALGSAPEDFPNATRAAARGVWFPSGAGKTPDDLGRVVESIREFADSAPGAGA